MDNVIYIVLAAAVFIALAGILLFIGGEALSNVDTEVTDIIGLGGDPDDVVGGVE